MRDLHAPAPLAAIPGFRSACWPAPRTRLPRRRTSRARGGPGRGRLSGRGRAGGDCERRARSDGPRPGGRTPPCRPDGSLSASSGRARATPRRCASAARTPAAEALERRARLRRAGERRRHAARGLLPIRTTTTPPAPRRRRRPRARRPRPLPPPSHARSPPTSPSAAASPKGWSGAGRPSLGLGGTLAYQGWAARLGGVWLPSKTSDYGPGRVEVGCHRAARAVRAGVRRPRALDAGPVRAAAGRVDARPRHRLRRQPRRRSTVAGDGGASIVARGSVGTIGSAGRSRRGAVRVLGETRFAIGGGGIAFATDPYAFMTTLALTTRVSVIRTRATRIALFGCLAAAPACGPVDAAGAASVRRRQGLTAAILRRPGPGSGRRASTTMRQIRLRRLGAERADPVAWPPRPHLSIRWTGKISSERRTVDGSASSCADATGSGLRAQRPDHRRLGGQRDAARGARHGRPPAGAGVTCASRWDPGLRPDDGGLRRRRRRAPVDRPPASSPTSMRIRREPRRVDEAAAVVRDGRGGLARRARGRRRLRGGGSLLGCVE